MNIFSMTAIRYWFGLIYSRFKQNILRRNDFKQVSPKNVVFITGCDSGLGYNLALFCHSLNMTVISGCHNINSAGAKLLQNVNDPKRMITIEIDLIKEDTISKASSFVQDLLTNGGCGGGGYEFTALVNNAGIMCFGEFEWQTRELFEKQINVNLLGTMRVTKEFLPLIRQQQSRIINVTSHCGLHSLPGVAAYSASKGGLKFWNDALRMELNKYGVNVVNFIPGSFVVETNILSRQNQYAEEMWTNLNEEQRSFYNEYFKEYNSYLSAISQYKKPVIIENEKFMNLFKEALLVQCPKSMYKYEPLRYKLYYGAFNCLPTSIADWLTERFVSMPKYQVVKKNE